MPKVVLFSGHMIDAPDRAEPRFPASREAAARSAISATLFDWQIGQGDICICGGARGGDILFAEECLKLGADLRLYLPLEQEAFLDASVRLPMSCDADWEARFKRLLNQAEVSWPAPAQSDENPFALNNRRMIHAARAEARNGPLDLLLLWNGEGGDGEGGTADLARQVRDIAQHVKIIDPAELRPDIT